VLDVDVQDAVRISVNAIWNIAEMDYIQVGVDTVDSAAVDVGPCTSSTSSSDE
jgi:hypothetical protein